MQRLSGDQQANRAQLKAKRDLLFANFLKDPSNTRLALEIKLVDDQIWESETNYRLSPRNISSQSRPMAR